MLSALLSDVTSCLHFTPGYWKLSIQFGNYLCLSVRNSTEIVQTEQDLFACSRTSAISSYEETCNSNVRLHVVSPLVCVLSALKLVRVNTVLSATMPTQKWYNMFTRTLELQVSSYEPVQIAALADISDHCHLKVARDRSQKHQKGLWTLGSSSAFNGREFAVRSVFACVCSPSWNFKTSLEDMGKFRVPLLVTVEWLRKQLANSPKLRILDATWSPTAGGYPTFGE